MKTVSENTKTAKRQFRSRMKALLRNMDYGLRRQKSSSACENLVRTQCFRDSAVVMMYLSIPYETDISEAIVHGFRQNKRVCVPRILSGSRDMEPVLIDSPEGLPFPQVSGLRNPCGGEVISASEIDMIITPGLGFDRNGNRLGRGGGFYDSFFLKNDRAVRCGFAFEQQMVEQIPVTDMDICMDMLVTDSRVINCD